MTINSQFFNDLHVFDISIVSGIRPGGRTIDHSCHARKSNGILYVWKGETTFYPESGKPVIVRDGEVAFIPKLKKYRMEYTAQSTTFVVVNFDSLDKSSGEVALFDSITLLTKDDKAQRIARIMMNFELCSVSKTMDATLRKKELMYRLLGAIFSGESCLPEKSETNPQIADGVHLLEQTYLENLPVAQYAAASHVSVNTFRSLFQKHFGMSPLKYRNHLRIERARELLCEGGFTVTEAAYASGFENIGYFCRYYRQITGESPGETKKRSQNDAL